MTIGEMFQQSAILTVLGMATVFIFLWLMIICVNLVGKLISALGLDTDAAPKDKPPNKASRSTPPEITAAITAAVAEYREKEEADE